MQAGEPMTAHLRFRCLLPALLACTLGFAACSQNSARVDSQDLRTLSIPGVDFGPVHGAVALDWGMVSILRELVRRGARDESLSGSTLYADSHLSVDAIARRVDVVLGEGWQRSSGCSARDPGIQLLVWETTGNPKRYYGLAAEEQVQTNLDGRSIRRMVAVFSRLKR